MERYELPDGWVWTTLGEVCTPPQYGYTTKAIGEPNGPRFLRITDLSKEGVNWDTVPYCDKPPADSEKFRLEDGDLVVARAGSVGKAYRVTNPPDAIFASYLIRFRAIGVSNDFLGYFLQSPVYWEQIEDSSTGTTMFNVNAQKLAALELPLPPLPEQLRIVEKIEALFEQSRTAREALDAIPALLRQFRQAVLAAAFRGELSTRDPNDEPASVLLERILEERRRRWEENLRAKGKDPRRYTYPEPAPPDTRDLPELPEGWCWATVDQVCFVNPKVDKPEYFDNETPISFVSMSAVDDFSGRIVTSETRTVGEVWKGYTRFAEGDVIFARITPCMENGKAAIATNLVNGIATGSTEFYVLRPTEAVLAEWIHHFIRQQSFRDEASRAMTGTAGQLRVPKLFMQQAVIPVAPINEQHRIVTRLDVLLAQADVIELASEFSRQRLNRLDQSILARAFRGELVPQDPNDEPASVLLERIRAEKARRAAERVSRRRGKGRK